MDQAEEIMVPLGYHVKNRSERSVTFAGRLTPGKAGNLISLATTLFDPSLGFEMSIAGNTMGEDTITLIAKPDDQATEVILPDKPSPSREAIRTWIEFNVLKLPSAAPIAKSTLSYSRLLVYTDRVERQKRIAFWKADGVPMPVEDICDVRLTKRGKAIEIEDRAARVISFGKAPRPEIEKLKQVIESRITVYSDSGAPMIT